jgi:NAD(P)-dependent dehydrogenase (short-subunit alcohol dehydrogenase family)
MVVFLTGGSGGIGSIISSVLKTEGMEVIEPTSKELDLTSNINVSNIKKIDAFIHCAGINNLAHHKDINRNELLNIFNINTFSFIELCNKLNINYGGNIIAIGSIYATKAKEERMQYTMSKHALYGCIKTLALEKAKDLIKVNMISPGFVNTLLTRKNNTKERIDFLNYNIPLGMTNPYDIANLCVFLIKYNNSITGQNIEVDGGYSLKGI